MGEHRPTALLLNVGHAIDHMFLLIFATAVASIAVEFGFSRWEDLMPYSAGAFLMFGLGSLPSGRLGDLWGRRAMMLVFFFGMGVSAILVSLTGGPWSMAAALVLLGAFSSIYHPVGIPMLVQTAKNPGLTIGVNGLAGNLGIAVAALVTGFFVKYIGWRAAFVVPGMISIACGVAFARLVPTRKRGARPALREGGDRAAARDDGADRRGDDADRDHRQPALQLHHQRQRTTDAGALRRHRRGSGDSGRAAGDRLRGRVARAGGRRAADRPLSAQADLPGDRAGAGPGSGAGGGGRRLACCSRSRSRSW